MPRRSSLAALAGLPASSAARSPGLPRHLSQHPGGMVISTRPLVELVPVEPAAMEGRQICQWDKDSCADAGFLKIDLLGLGMLSAVEECVDQIVSLRGETIDLSRIPLDDPAVYREIQEADTVGLFQIESRAQMQSLLRTRPENLDDLTVQVALVRPGPIQGKAVHPYVERRQRRREDPDYEPPVRPSAPGRAAPGHARGDHLPGPGARRRDRARRLQRGGGRGPAPGDEPQAERTTPSRPTASASTTARPARASTRETAELVFVEDQRLRRLRLPEVPRSRLRRSSPTSRPGFATTIRRSSSARS